MYLVDLMQGRNLGVLDKVVLVLLRQLLEATVLGLGQEQGREDAGQHEKGKDLENVGQELALAADVDQAREADLYVSVHIQFKHVGECLPER